MLEVKNLSKHYPSFDLREVSFDLHEGEIIGFIGQNGAGKSTTLKCIMRAVVADGGDVFVDGNEMRQFEAENKQIISFTYGAFDYYRNEKLHKIAKVYRTFYSKWNESLFEGYCKKFKLELNKRVKELSAGMKVKFALALAMSHEAKYFLFDEPTSGLDPIARDEMLDVFRDIVDEGDKGILFSTHITGDLDKCADRILFIADGKIIVDEGKDKLLDEHVIIKGSKEQFEQLQHCVVAAKKHSLGFTALARRSLLPVLDGFVTEKPTLDDIMVYYNKGEEQC